MAAAAVVVVMVVAQVAVATVVVASHSHFHYYYFHQYSFVASTADYIYPSLPYHSNTNMDSFYPSRQSYENQSNSIVVERTSIEYDESIVLILVFQDVEDDVPQSDLCWRYCW